MHITKPLTNVAPTAQNAINKEYKPIIKTVVISLNQIATLYYIDDD